MSTPNYTDYSGFSTQTITVSTQAELQSAMSTLSSSGGGTIQLDGNGGPYQITGNGLGGASDPILIEGADVNNPPAVSEVYLQNSSYITMTGLDIDSSVIDGNAAPYADFRLLGSNHIELVGNDMSSTANGYLDGSAGVTQGGSAMFIRASSDIRIADNVIQDYGGGIGLMEVQNITIDNNEMMGIQKDFIQGVGIQDAKITNNHMHDPYGSIQAMNHSDFIQIFALNAQSVTQNIEIAGNILDTGTGNGYQGIFITSNQLGSSGPQGQYYQNISVHDNVVHTGSYHGITVGQAQGVDIYNNTVLWDEDAFVQQTQGGNTSIGQPWIMTNTNGANVYNNTTGSLSVAGDSGASANNTMLNYNDAAVQTYFENMDLSSYGTNGSIGIGGTGSGWTSSAGGSTSGSSSSGGSTGNTTDTSNSDTSNSDTSNSDTSNSDTSNTGSTNDDDTTDTSNTGSSGSGTTDTGTDTDNDTNTANSGSDDTDTTGSTGAGTGSSDSGSDDDQSSSGSQDTGSDTSNSDGSTSDGSDDTSSQSTIGDSSVFKFLRIRPKNSKHGQNDKVQEMRKELNNMFKKMTMQEIEEMAAEADASSNSEEDDLNATSQSEYREGSFRDKSLAKYLKVIEKGHARKHGELVDGAQDEVHDLLKSVKVGDLLRTMKQIDDDDDINDGEDEEEDVLDYHMLM